jgi:hypothetical protein
VQVFRNLNGAKIWGKDMDNQFHPSCCDLEVARNVIEVLNTGTYEWLTICRVGDFRTATSRKLDTLGRVPINEVLVSG